MALTITTFEALNDYIHKVMERADHHGQNVNEIVLAIAGAVLWRATQDVEVRSNNNDGTGNVLWLTINGNRYVLAYNHNTFNIEIRQDSMQGAVLASFNNSNSIDQVKGVFATL